MKFSVPDMNCNGCASSITKAIKAIDANATVSADIEHKTISVETTQSQTGILGALDDAGFPATACAG